MIWPSSHGIVSSLTFLTALFTAVVGIWRLFHVEHALQEIHVLVNSRLSTTLNQLSVALDKISKLESVVHSLTDTVPSDRAKDIDPLDKISKLESVVHSLTDTVPSDRAKDIDP
jgi:hypothetical protein